MAFSSAGGYANLPNGNWAPAIYSQKVLKFFRTASVVEDIQTPTMQEKLKTLATRLKSSKSLLLLSPRTLAVQF